MSSAMALSITLLWASASAAQESGEPVSVVAEEKTDHKITNTTIQETKSEIGTKSSDIEIYLTITPVPVEMEGEETDDEFSANSVSGNDGEVLAVIGRTEESTEGDSGATEGDEQAPVGDSDGSGAPMEVEEEPVVVTDDNDNSMPEESTYVEEPAPEEPPVVEEEPVVEEPQMEYLGDWTISFYCNCWECCQVWSGGPTASGAMPSAWWTVATGDLPFGTILYVDGLGTFEVQDRGTDYGWLDIYVSSHDEALANGLQYRSVYIVR